MDDIPSSQTRGGSSPLPEPLYPIVGFSDVPVVFVLPTHFVGNEGHDVEQALLKLGVSLTSDASRAELFIGKVGTKRRAEFELRRRQFKIEEIVQLEESPSLDSASREEQKNRNVERAPGSGCKPTLIRDVESTTESETELEHPPKRRRLDSGSSSRDTSNSAHSSNDDQGTEGETEDESLNAARSKRGVTKSPAKSDEDNEVSPHVEDAGDHDVVSVVKLDWVKDSLASGCILPLSQYLVYQGKVLERPVTSSDSRTTEHSFPSQTVPKIAPASRIAVAAPPSAVHSDILERAKADAIKSRPKTTAFHPYKPADKGSQRFEGRTFMHHSGSQAQQLIQQTTSEYEGDDSDVPEPPAWVKRGIKFACQRHTPADSPNASFINELKKIRKARDLTGDQIGVRAYSTSIAAIAAYPYPFTSPREILALPGCEAKIVNLWVEYKNTGRVQAADDAENDEDMKVLKLFYDIWGVGASTARDFYFKKHWVDLDDVIEYGWDSLTRVQQIGVKYYSEFLEPIPRIEVESIASIIREHAIRVRDDDISLTIVGGYRRGKDASGDVDVIVSHPEFEKTANLITDIVVSLEEEEWITHTLTLSLNGTHRGQATLPFRTQRAAGVGFDTLDKALVVWQDTNWPTRNADLASNPKAKNPNIHRRVDIIISPWRTVGCAVMGWSGGTTFQRDLRRYAKYAKGWKFDSSGIRDRANGQVVNLEGPNGVNGSAIDAERTVFDGMGLEFIPPEERCTG